MMLPCPRRIEGPDIAGSDPSKDAWRPDDTCSFCGSVNPDVLMARIEAGTVQLGPTDKRYKIYVENEGGDPIGTKFYFQHFSEDQRRRFVDLHNERRLHIGHPGHFYVLPFFMGVVKK